MNVHSWDRHIPDSNLLMKSDYLKIIEDTQKGKMEFRYVLVQHQGRTIGAIYFQLVSFQGEQLMNYFPKGDTVLLNIGRSMSRKLLTSLNLKMLVSGNIFMTGENGFYFSPDIDKPASAGLLRQSIRRIWQEDKSIKAVLLSDLYTPETSFDSGFFSEGYYKITVESDMSILLRKEWQNFDDYLLSLSSKYRVRAKKVFSLCEENKVTCRELHAQEIKMNEQRLYELYRKVLAKANFQLGELTSDYFYQQKLQLPDNYHLFAYYRQDDLIGFISLFHNGNKVEVHYVGMDHDLCRPIHLYQHMMYDMVNYGIKHRAERLHFGRTAPEIKSTIGATPSPMYGYLKHRNRLFNLMIMRNYSKRLKPPTYTLRNPFK